MGPEKRRLGKDLRVSFRHSLSKLCHFSGSMKKRSTSMSLLSEGSKRARKNIVSPEFRGPRPISPPPLPSGGLLSEVCKTFLEVDQRPTAIAEVQQGENEGVLEVKFIFENEAFERLRNEVEFVFNGSDGIGGILTKDDSPRWWEHPKGNLRLSAVRVHRSAEVDGQWVKAIIAEMVVWPEDDNAEVSLTDDDLFERVVGVLPDEHLENYGGGGVGDVRRISIAEEPAGVGEETSSSSRTITPAHYKNLTNLRGSRSPSAVASRRSSRSGIASRRSSHSSSTVSAPVPAREQAAIARRNMDWTKGEVLRKNTLSISGMEEHLIVLRNVLWQETPLGPQSGWSISLRCISNVIMSFPHPSMVFWGTNLITIYNAPAKVMPGKNHPFALGKPFEDAFPAYKVPMLPMLHGALQGETSLKQDELLFLNISVPNEECYYNFIVSPIIGSSGTAEGALKQAHSRTSQVIQARRMATLNKIREEVELVTDLDRDDFWQLVLAGLGRNENDSPFALIYKVVSESRCVLVGSLGIPDQLIEEGDLIPQNVRVGGKTSSSSGVTGNSSRDKLMAGDEITPISTAEDTGTSSSSGLGMDFDEPFLFHQEMMFARDSNSVVAKDLTKCDLNTKKKLSNINYRGFGDPCTHAVVIPIQPSPTRTFGFLILGLNPRRPYDNEYLDWLNMLMEQLAMSIGRVRLLTEDLRRAVQDARHQKQLASHAMERKKQQESFIDISSHELRNPLSAVLQSAEGIINLLGRSKRHGVCIDTEMIADSARTILLCVNHQRLIIEDILAVSKLDSNLMTVNPVPVEPTNMVWKALRMFEGELSAKGIEWDFVVEPGYTQLEVKWVDLDPGRTTQVLVNLLANAIKFTALKEGVKKICLFLDGHRERPMDWDKFDYLPFDSPREAPDSAEWGTDETLYLSISVNDTGIGISEKNQNNLFKRFNQVPKTHVTYGGSGLGLYICRRLCELLGGNIGVSSIEGQGSTFRFYVKARRIPEPQVPPSLQSTPGRFFPQQFTSVSDQDSDVSTVQQANYPASETQTIRTMASQTEQTAQSIAISTGKPRFKVLVVEDNLINQKVLRQQLISEGCIVITANNGQEALDVIAESSFSKPNGFEIDVVLMDMEMPIMGGIEATKRIRELETDHVPIIGISANARPEQMSEMTRAGMDDAIPKPFRIPNLLSKIDMIVARERDRMSDLT